MSLGARESPAQLRRCSILRAMLWGFVPNIDVEATPGMLSIRAISLIAAILTVALGCDSADRNPAGNGNVPETKVLVEKTANALSAPPAFGLADPMNDALVVERAKAVLACDWSTRHTFRPSSKCAALRPWYAAAETANATLLNMTTDEDQKVRYIAAEQLAGNFFPRERDPALAARVMDALAAEKFEPAAWWLAKAVGFVDAEKTGLGKRQQELFTNLASVKVKAQLLHYMQYINAAYHFEFTTRIARTAKDDTIREAAVTAFWLGMPRDKQAEVCKLWLDAVDDPVVTIAARAASMAGQSSSSRADCSAHFDSLLAKIERYVAAKGGLERPEFAQGLEAIFTSPKSSPKQKRRAKAALARILPNEAHHWFARSRALGVLVKDAGGGKKLAKKYLKDKDPLIAKRAQELIDEIKKEKKRKR